MRCGRQTGGGREQAVLAELTQSCKDRFLGGNPVEKPAAWFTSATLRLESQIHFAKMRLSSLLQLFSGVFVCALFRLVHCSEQRIPEGEAVRMFTQPSCSLQLRRLLNAVLLALH